MNEHMNKNKNTNTNHPQPLYSLLSIVVPPPNDRDLSSHLQRIFLGNYKKNHILIQTIYQYLTSISRFLRSLYALKRDCPRS